MTRYQRQRLHRTRELLNGAREKLLDGYLVPEQIEATEKVRQADNILLRLLTTDIDELGEAEA